MSRYVAKIHILDVMDRVVVSGYWYDADPMTDPDHDPSEFTIDVQGQGVTDGWDWLRWACYQIVMCKPNPATGKLAGSGAAGQ